MADTTGAVDLSAYMRKDEHARMSHRVGDVLQRASTTLPGNPRISRVGESPYVASSDHVHAAAPVYIRQDGVSGGDDRQFADQTGVVETIYLGTMIASVDPLDATKRMLSIRFNSNWYSVPLVLDTLVSGGHDYTSVSP